MSNKQCTSNYGQIDFQMDGHKDTVIVSINLCIRILNVPYVYVLILYMYT